MRPVLHRKPSIATKLAGWTFVETIIVIGIVLILTTSVGLMAFRYLGQAKSATAKSQIATYSLAINAYYLDVRNFPDPINGLEALWSNPGVDGWNGPYISKRIQPDPWGNPYVYKVPGPDGYPFEIVSLGADGQPGGEGENADITTAE